MKTTWKYSVGSRSARRRLEPRGAGQRLTGRTVAFATGLVPDAPMTAVVTLLDVAAEDAGGAALLDGRHHAAVHRREGGPDLDPEVSLPTAEHLRHGEHGPFAIHGTMRPGTRRPAYGEAHDRLWGLDGPAGRLSGGRSIRRLPRSGLVQ